MAKKLHAQKLNGKNRSDIEQLATVVKSSSNRFSTYSNDTLQAIAYVLLKTGKSSPTQIDIEDANITVLAAQTQIQKVNILLMDILEKIDDALSPQSSHTFTPSPLENLLPKTDVSFSPGTIAGLNWENNKIPLQRTDTPSGKCCLANNSTDNSKTSSEIYTKIFLYMIFGGQYPYANLLTESHIAKIITIRNKISKNEKDALQEKVTTHFTQNTELKDNLGDFTQKIELLFQGLDIIISELNTKLEK